MDRKCDPSSVYVLGPWTDAANVTVRQDRVPKARATETDDFNTYVPVYIREEKRNESFSRPDPWLYPPQKALSNANKNNKLKPGAVQCYYVYPPAL